MPVQIGPNAGPVVVLLAAFWRSTHTNNFTLDTEFPRVLSSAPAMTKLRHDYSRSETAVKYTLVHGKEHQGQTLSSIKEGNSLGPE